MLLCSGLLKYRIFKTLPASTHLSNAPWIQASNRDRSLHDQLVGHTNANLLEVRVSYFASDQHSCNTNVAILHLCVNSAIGVSKLPIGMSLPTCQYELRIDRNFLLAVFAQDDHDGPLIIPIAEHWTFWLG